MILGKKACKKIFLVIFFWTLCSIPVTHSQEKIYELCQRYRDINIAGIYPCLNSEEGTVLLQMFICEDCPNFYFRLDKTFIADCCVAECSVEPTELCREMKALTCDFTKNLYPDLCEGKNIKVEGHAP